MSAASSGAGVAAAIACPDIRSGGATVRNSPCVGCFTVGKLPKTSAGPSRTASASVSTGDQISRWRDRIPVHSASVFDPKTSSSLRTSSAPLR